MAGPFALVERVQIGEVSSAWCDHCATHARRTATMYALTSGGVITIGGVSYCPSCGADSYRCAHCSALLAFQPALIIEHIPRHRW
jgi:hypothetical protein